MAHTPGPWTIEVAEQACFHNGNRVSISKEYPPSDENGWEGRSETVAEVWPTNPPDADMDIADGCLIAAAPDLLQVAEGCLSWLKALPRDHQPDLQWFKPLEAAIRAARLTVA